jgi:hypothetical protein
MANRPFSATRIVQPSALHPSPSLQRRDLPPIDLCAVEPDGFTRDDDFGFVVEPAPTVYEGDVDFVVTTPEVRSRIKVDLIYVPNMADPRRQPGPEYYWLDPVTAAHRNLFGNTALWMTKREEPALGGGYSENVENLVGDIYTSQPIPDPGCMGFVGEFETASQEVWGRLHVKSTDLWSGRWVLKVAANAVYDMNDVEWNRVCSRFACRALGSLRLLGKGIFV